MCMYVSKYVCMYVCMYVPIGSLQGASGALITPCAPQGHMVTLSTEEEHSRPQGDAKSRLQMVVALMERV